MCLCFVLISRQVLNREKCNCGVLCPAPSVMGTWEKVEKVDFTGHSGLKKLILRNLPFFYVHVYQLVS